MLDFAESLQPVTAEPRKPLRGLWKDLGVSISEEDIASSAGAKCGAGQPINVPERQEPNPRFVVAPLDLSVAIAVRAEVPDLPDRVIAATAVALDLPLVTKDRRIAGGESRHPLVSDRAAR